MTHIVKFTKQQSIDRIWARMAAVQKQIDAADQYAADVVHYAIQFKASGTPITTNERAIALGKEWVSRRDQIANERRADLQVTMNKLQERYKAVSESDEEDYLDVVP